MARHPGDAPGDKVRLPVVVVDAVDHGVFKGDAAARLLEVIVAGGEQLLHVIGPVHRHDAGAVSLSGAWRDTDSVSCS